MARAAGAIVRREDWFILAFMLALAGVVLNDAAKNGDAHPGSIFRIFTRQGWRDFKACYAHPIRCGRDVMERMDGRMFAQLGFVSVALTVALRRFYPKLSGLPYAALFTIGALAVVSGRADSFLRALDPREWAEALEGLLRRPAVAPAPAPAPPVVIQSPPAPGVQYDCADANALCGGARGGLERVYGTGAGIPCGRGDGSRGQGGRYCECKDGSTWDRLVPRGRSPIMLSPARPACLSEGALSAEHGAAKHRFTVPGGCGYTLFSSGRVVDMRTGQVIATEAGWRDIARRYGFPVWSEIERLAR